MLEGFRGSTVLCIAHRLRTIVEYDLVIVMAREAIVERDQLERW